jgi:anti-anti-sigma regulatory factor
MNSGRAGGLSFVGRQSSSIVLVFGGPVTADEVPSLCNRVCGLLSTTDAELVVCDVGAVVDPDVAAVDALARLQLAATRLGRRVCVRNASPEFRALLAFMGLAEVISLRAPLRLETRRQPEERKERVGVEEERELPDAIA